ncbi:hypothetical protein EBY67_07785, partial [bacterium]|nr:hypothetical protein [bacterium]
PAFVAKCKNKEEKGAEAEEGGERCGVAVKKFGDQVWGGDKEGKSDESHDHLLGREILHEP